MRVGCCLSADPQLLLGLVSNPGMSVSSVQQTGKPFRQLSILLFFLFVFLSVFSLFTKSGKLAILSYLH